MSDYLSIQIRIRQLEYPRLHELLSTISNKMSRSTILKQLAEKGLEQQTHGTTLPLLPAQTSSPTQVHEINEVREQSPAPSLPATQSALSENGRVEDLSDLFFTLKI